MEKVLNVTLDRIINDKDRYEKYFMENELLIIETDSSHAYKLNPVFYPLRIDAYSLILILRGEMTIDVNYMTYVMKKNDMMELFSYHLVESLNFSSDFKAYQIVVCPDLYHEIIEYTKLSKVLDCYSGGYHLVKTIETNEIDVLITQIERIKKTMTRGSHHLFKTMIKSELILLLTELAHIKLLHQPSEESSFRHTRCEEIAFQFIQLLVTHCKAEHEVAFYAEKLCITSEYLSRIMKSFSGKSVKVWIQQARVAEAKVLLRKPYSSIYQVADELYFSDQSAFGKFFKKHTGKSPLEYQRESDTMFFIPNVKNTNISEYSRQ
ncbi:MAG: helix-turn-helix domain-containing protein [Tannerella sp.]|jgi:AraC-like DNA-binding protein|nr:helix-turn-helix domain-containing protein [Tannerella sp.]